MTHISFSSNTGYCAAARRELGGLADRIAAMERRPGGDDPAERAELDGRLRGLEALLARTEFAGEAGWRPLAAQLDRKLAELRHELATA